MKKHIRIRYENEKRYLEESIKYANDVKESMRDPLVSEGQDRHIRSCEKRLAQVKRKLLEA